MVLNRFEIADEIEGSRRFMLVAANCFYIIAFLSLFSTIMYLSESPFYFVYFLFGLGSTQLMDSFTLNVLASSMGTAGYAIGIFADVLIVAVFILLGYFAGSKKVWPFVAGIILYVLDALIFVMAEDFLSIFFHVLMLLVLLLGIRAVKKLVKAEQMLSELDKR